MQDQISDDAELIELGHLMNAAFASAEASGITDDECDLRADQVDDIADQIRAIAPTTLVGLMVKARTLCWDIGYPEAVDFLVPEIDAPTWQLTEDERVGLEEVEARYRDCLNPARALSGFLRDLEGMISRAA